MNYANETAITGSGVDEAERHAEEVVEELNSLSEGDPVVARLIACGPAAIAPLRRFLFLGKPGVVYQPRRWAVEALGGLGAKDTLIEYLTWTKDVPDPAVRMTEEVVENAAARELARWRTEDVRDVLLRFAIPRSRSGIVEALGLFGCAEAIPYFVHALEEDLCRSAAEEALRTLGRQAQIALIDAARTLLPTPEEECPSSRRRRTKALEILAELGPCTESWPLLKPLLADRDAGIVTAAANLAVTLGDRHDKAAAVDRLLVVLPAADWYLRTEIQACLLSLYEEGRSRIEEEIARRRALPETERAVDTLLCMLLSLRRRAEQGRLQGRTE